MPTSGERVFIDASIILYLHDRSAGDRRAQATQALEQVDRDNDGVISTQTLFEVRNVGTRKLGVSRPMMRQILEDLISRFEVVSVLPHHILRSLDIQDAASVSNVDSVMVATAHEAGCVVLLTEDLNHGQIVAGVRIENPFKPAK